MVHLLGNPLVLNMLVIVGCVRPYSVGLSSGSESRGNGEGSSVFCLDRLFLEVPSDAKVRRFITARSALREIDV